MSEWRESCLGDVCAYVKDRRSTEGLTLDDYISTENLLPNKGGYTTASSIPDVGQVTAFLSGDVLVSNIRPYFKKIWQATFDSGCSNDVLVFRARPGIDARWLHYVLANDAFFDHCMAGAKGCKMPRGDKQQIMEYPVSLPSLPTQRRIAAVLGALDDKIELNRKMNANLEAMAQALFKSWFVDFEPFGGQMPEGWRRGTLGEIANLYREAWNPAKHLGVTVSHFSLPAFDQFRFPVSECADGIKSNKLKIDADSLLVSKLNPEIKRIWRPTVFDEVSVASTEYVVMRATQREYRDWLFSILDSDAFSSYLCSNVAGTTNSHQRVDPRDIMRFDVVIPKDNDAAKFSKMMTVLYDRVYANIVQSRTLAQLRDTLLPKLMSGELNVDDVKIEDAAGAGRPPYQDLRLSA